MKKTGKQIVSSILFFVLLFTVYVSKGQSASCFATLKNDTLVIRNNMIEQKWLWNNGDILAYSIRDAGTGKIIFFEKPSPAFHIEGQPFQKNLKFEVSNIGKTLDAPAHLEVLVLGQYQSIALKRIFKIFPGTPAISCDYHLKYTSLFQQPEVAKKQVDGTEKAVFSESAAKGSYMAQYSLASMHWQVKAVSFKDATDINDNLVFEQQLIPYRVKEEIVGNLLFAHDLVSKSNFFILKEAPNGKSQLNYPGYDFAMSNKELSIPFSGFPTGSKGEEWIKGYTITTGVGNSSQDGLIALRTYLKNSINYDPSRYEMVMMNTWGDRGQDGKLSEPFILRELAAAEKLGISHFQIDDGWQQGLSSNSVNKDGNLWDSWTPQDWVPNKERFPNGLKEIIRSAKDKNIKMGLWFHPSNQDSYASWEADAKVVIDLYKTAGIQYFKIDGLKTPDKLAEENLTKFFNKVREATDGKVFFNLDLTAGIRGGYFSYRSVGNLFLENRYTDFVRYFPFHTMRNLWMLSKYFPPELLQVEFLNKWRNAEKYLPNDPFAPANYSFEYVFATTMAAQPLAWFEATGLPEEGMAISNAIKKYREIQADFHAGHIFPIGEEPSGRSWTGFQSVKGDQGYFLVFREDNSSAMAEIKSFLAPDKKIVFTHILGEVQPGGMEAVVSPESEVKFRLPKKNSYLLYKYAIE